MTKADIVSKIVQKTGIDKDDVGETLETLFKTIKASMSEGNNIYIRGFGSFLVKKRAKKIGRIISKNKPITIPEHHVPSFKAAKSFTKMVKDSHQAKGKKGK